MTRYFGEWRACSDACRVTGVAQEGLPMSPAELKQANLDHFRRLLEHASDPDQRVRIEGLMAEEKLKPASAYPLQRPAPRG